MNDQDKQQAFLEKTRGVLDQAVNEVDVATANELRMMRHKALKPQPRNWFMQHSVPLFASTAAVLMITASLMLNQGAEPIGATDVEYLALMSEKEGLDFYQDLEFYDWLEEESANG